MSSPHRRFHPPTNEGSVTRFLLVAAAVLYIGLFLLTPLIAVFTEGFRNGADAFFNAIAEKDALSAIKLTFIVAAIAVPLNSIFGLAASWAIAKHDFKGKS